MKKTMVCLLVVATIGWFVARYGIPKQRSDAQAAITKPEELPVKCVSLEVSTPEVMQSPVVDWARALTEASAAPDWEQSELLEDVVAEMPVEQIPAVLDQLVQQHSGAALIFAEMLLERWANQSPGDAALWIQRLPDDEFGQKVFSKVAREWGEQDVASAMNWVRSLPENGNKTAAEESIAFAGAASDRADEALALLSGIPESAERNDAWSYAVRRQAMNNLDAAVISAKELGSPDDREQLLARMATDLGAQNPFRAAEFISKQMGASESRDAAVIEVVRFWAAAAPDEAMAWVHAFPESPLRTAANANLLDVLQRDGGKQSF